MRKNLILLGFLICNILSNAQNISIDKFTRLEAKGEIPSNLLEIANSNIKLKNKHEENLRNQIKKFILSGKIIFGDEVSNYINTIVDGLLINDQKLREKINVYVIKSSQSNAFATSNGYLFLTIGFIAQSTSEAELAFAISHEIIHYTKQHGYSLKDNFDDIDDFLSYHSRSRDQEFQCDREGYLDYYLKSGYDKDSPMGIYDILQYSYLPFDELKLDRTCFENEYYQFKDNYFLESITPISSRENYIDTFSTHPNLKLRREEMRKLIEDNSSHIGNKFLQSKSKFERIRNLCRFETINQEILSDNYIKSYYNTLVLLEEFPDNRFLRTSKIASIYGISKVKTYGNYSRYLLTKKETEGEIQFIANFFEKANKKEAALLALRDIWEGVKLDSNNYYQSLFDDIIKDLSLDMRLDNLNIFSDLRMDEEYKESESDNNDNLSKYDKIKTNKTVGHQKKFTTENYMLADLKKDENFIRAFETSLLKTEKKQADELINKLKKKDNIPEIKSLIIFEPTSYTLNKNKKPKKSSSTNTKKSKSFERMISKSAKNNGINPILISENSFDTNLSYQLRSKLCDFKLGLNRFAEIYYETRDMENYKKELKTPYINFINLVKTPSSNENLYYKSIHLGMGAGFAYPLLPISIYQWAKIPYSGELNFLVYDLNNSSFISNNSISFEYERTKDFEKQALDKNYKRINENKNKYKEYGYQGRRLLFAFGSNISPALFTPNRNGKQGFQKFDYSFSPSLEFVLNNKYSIGGGINFMETKFKCKEDYPEKYLSLGSMDITGYSLFFKSYKAIAPIGYYYKLQLDYITYRPNLIWIETISSNFGSSSYDKKRLFNEKGYNLGLRAEYGKVFFINDYFQISTGCSLGLSFKGWSSLFSIEDTQTEEFPNIKIRKAYIFGINLNIGILPF